MSNIEYQLIDANFPVASVNNDTQGFRNNFSTIKTALSVARLEIESLQNRTVQIATNSIPPSPALNNLMGSTIHNGVVYNLRNAVYVSTNNQTTVIVDVTAAPLQVFKLSGNTTLTLAEFPNSNESGSIRIHLYSESIAYIPQFKAQYDSTEIPIKYSSEFSVTAIPAGTHRVYEAWWYNANSFIFMRSLGDYASFN